MLSISKGSRTIFLDPGEYGQLEVGTSYLTPDGNKNLSWMTKATVKVSWFLFGQWKVAPDISGGFVDSVPYQVNPPSEAALYFVWSGKKK